jgi:hypothetical protein
VLSLLGGSYLAMLRTQIAKTESSKAVATLEQQDQKISYPEY